jgi:hypothetical protein
MYRILGWCKTVIIFIFACLGSVFSIGAYKQFSHLKQISYMAMVYFIENKYTFIVASFKLPQNIFTKNLQNISTTFSASNKI